MWNCCNPEIIVFFYYMALHDFGKSISTYLFIYLYSAWQTKYVSVYQFKMDFSPFYMYHHNLHHLFSFAFQMWFIVESLEVNGVHFRERKLKRSERHSNKRVNKSPTSSQGKLWPRFTPGNTPFISFASPDMENKPKCFACSLTLSAGWALPEALTPLSLRPPLGYKV